MDTAEVGYLKNVLKSGEYDGGDLMRAWICLEGLCVERDRYREALKLIRFSSFEVVAKIAAEALDA